MQRLYDLLVRQVWSGYPALSQPKTQVQDMAYIEFNDVPLKYHLSMPLSCWCKSDVALCRSRTPSVLAAPGRDCDLS